MTNFWKKRPFLLFDNFYWAFFKTLNEIITTIKTSSFNTTTISFNFSTKRCFWNKGNSGLTSLSNGQVGSKILTEIKGGAYSGVKMSMSFFNLKSPPGAYSEEYGNRRVDYWAICSSVRLFTRTAHSFACSALPSSLAPSPAHIHSLALKLMGKMFMSLN